MKGSLQWFRRGRVLLPWFWRGRGGGREESFRGCKENWESCIVYKEVLVGWGWKQGHGTTRWHELLSKVSWLGYLFGFLCWLICIVRRNFIILMTILIISSCGIADHTSTFLCYFEKVAVWSAICTLFIWYLVLCLFPNLGCKTSAWLL